MTGTEHPVDGLRISPRTYVGLEEFGRIANPEAIINPTAPDPYEPFFIDRPSVNDDRYLAAISRVPISAGGLWDQHTENQYQPQEDTSTAQGEPEPQNDAEAQVGDTHPLRGTGTITADESTITVIGNLTNDPVLRCIPSSREFGKTDGTPVANFTIASTPRTFDPDSNEWTDGQTLFLRASAWREMGENVAASLSKGSRVIVSGRLKSRSYETKEGTKRTVLELDVDEIGPSLRFANGRVIRTKRSRNDETKNEGCSGTRASTSSQEEYGNHEEAG